MATRAFPLRQLVPLAACRWQSTGGKAGSAAGVPVVHTEQRSLHTPDLLVAASLAHASRPAQVECWASVGRVIAHMGKDPAPWGMGSEI